MDLERYAGLWYEIAKIPNRFQKQCAGGTTAEYALLDNGRVQVTNRCRDSDGDLDSITGIARVVDTTSNAKLQVSFVRFLGKYWFWGDYWIIGLDENYEWAVVGNPSRKYGWILARSAQLSEADLERCYEILREQEYDPAEFVKTEHNQENQK